MNKFFAKVSVDDLIKLQNDKSKQLKSSEYKNSGALPIVDQGSGLICGYTDDASKRYDKGLPVIIFGDHTLHTKFIDFDFAIGADGTQIIVPKSPNCDAKYLYYVVHRAAQLIGSEGYKRHLSILREFEVDYIFDRKSQQKIASILTAVDEVIASTTAQINKLKDLKTGMMQELLTKGIGRGGQPHTEFKVSPVGRIPRSWEVEPLANVFGMASGSTPSRKDSTYFSVSSDAIPWVKTMDLDDGKITKTTEKITQRAIKETSCKLLPIGSTLVAMYGGWNQIGRSGVLGIPAATNQAICALIPKTRVTGEFCNYWLISKRDNWKSIAASSRKDPNITKQDVEEFLIAIPPKQEQLDIVKILDVATHSVNIRQDKLRNLTNLKKALMHDLLTGKVRSI